jgi:hypothetical protein
MAQNTWFVCNPYLLTQFDIMYVGQAELCSSANDDSRLRCSGKVPLRPPTALSHGHLDQLTWLSAEQVVPAADAPLVWR